MDYNSLLTNTNIIIENLNLLDSNITQLKKKVSSINKVYQKLLGNKILVNDTNNTYLIFQTNILKNEHSYYKTIYELVITKYSKEVYELNEYLVLILLALHKLEIDKPEENQQIFHKIMTIKRDGQINYGKIKEIINAVVNNLKLIEDYITLFNNFVEEIKRKNRRHNIHNNNFELTIINKKENIMVEYQKYCSKFKRIVTYFTESTNAIIHQINNSEILKFFLT